MRLLLVFLLLISPAFAKKSILFIAGNPSHGNGEHEFRAGSMLLAKALNESGLDVEAKVHYYGWPKDESIFDGVDACIVYADAGGKFGEKYAFLDKKVKAGMGIMFMHYGVHPSKEVGQKYFMPWIGGYMETGWSVNPHWVADITTKEKHPVGNGVTPGFKSFDEYYWNMRFPTEKECSCCHALATSVPTPEKIVRYINLWNEHGERTMGTKQALMWCRDPKTGGRGVGFVGGHYHRNWAIDDFRKLVLNSIVWLARADVPKDGVPSKPITQAQLNENLDRPVKGKPVLLPTDELLKYRPMKMPDLKKRKERLERIKKARERKAKELKQGSKKNDAWKPNTPANNVSLKNFVVPEGLEITRWASSPQLYNPTNIDFDHKGRLWVAEGVNYRRHNGRRPGGDRITVLEDTDGDGKCDKSHTFVQEKELIAPLGVAVFDNVVVVSQPPHLIVYTDVNRNLKFDPESDKREILLTGFNAINHDHSLHSVTAGPDGKWYFNNGNCGAVFTDKSGKTFRMTGSYYKSGGGVWPVDHTKFNGQKSDDGFVWTSGFSVRMNPDGTQAEIIGHGYRNSYEHATNSFGDLFQSDNDDFQSCRTSYVLEYGSAGFFTRDGQSWKSQQRRGQPAPRAHWRQDDPGTFDAGDIYGTGSPTGVTFYENGALPPKFNGSYLFCEAARNTVFSYPYQPKGASFDLKRSDFLTSNPKKQFIGGDFNPKLRRMEDSKDDSVLFRPSDIVVGPDGALYVSDWYDGRVGGHSDLDNSCSGAIYRIAPKGFKSSVPSIDYTTIAGQLTALTSPAVNVRFGGFQALKQGGAASYSPVSKLLTHPNPWIAARAIWLLPHLGKQGLEKCVSLLDDDNPQTRLTAYRALRRADVDILPHAKKLATDTSPAVRRDVALSMRGISPEKSASILVAVANGYDGKDKNYLEAIGLGSENHESAIWKAIKASQGNPAPDNWTDKFARLTWRLWPSSAVADLKARALSTKLTPEQRIFAVESISFINHQTAAHAMLELTEEKSPVKAEAASWLLRRSSGAWKNMNLMAELKKRDIYNPDKITVTPITVTPSAKPKFSVKDVLALKGNAEKGKQTLMRCIMCHEVDQTGPAYGPHLKGWGQTQTKEVIARSIIEPNADIAHGYTGYKVILKDGNEVHGLLISNTNPVIIKSTGGLTQMIPRSRIKQVKRLGYTLMLSADQLGMSAQDVADLVEYLKQWK